MLKRSASAEWKGTIMEGSGTFSVQSGKVGGVYSVPTRFADAEGTNPEELIGAAHASCFSMALSAGLSRAGFKPTSIRTTAVVHIAKYEGGWNIDKIALSTEAEIPDIDEKTFLEQAQGAKKGCPISKALAGPEITLEAKLV